MDFGRPSTVSLVHQIIFPGDYFLGGLVKWSQKLHFEPSAILVSFWQHCLKCQHQRCIVSAVVQHQRAAAQQKRFRATAHRVAQQKETRTAGAFELGDVSSSCNCGTLRILPTDRATLLVFDALVLQLSPLEILFVLTTGHCCPRCCSSWGKPTRWPHGEGQSYFFFLEFCDQGGCVLASPCWGGVG